jgi:hypothetical protein
MASTITDPRKVDWHTLSKEEVLTILKSSRYLQVYHDRIIPIFHEKSEPRMSMHSLYNFTKVLDIVLLGLFVTFFIGLLAFDLPYFGFQINLITLPHEAKPYFEILPWLIFGLLAFDIYLKLKKLGSWNVLVKKHWLDLLMLALIPIFMPLKFMKPTVKLFKVLKATKFGIKVIHKIKKIKAFLK